MDKSTREELATATQPGATEADKARAFDLLMESKAPPASDDGVSANFERDAVAALLRSNDRDDAREVLHIALTRLQTIAYSPALVYLVNRIAFLLEHENEHPETFAEFCGTREQDNRGSSAQHDLDALAAVDLLLRRYHFLPKHGVKQEAVNWISEKLGPSRRTVRYARQKNKRLENVLEPESSSDLPDKPQLSVHLRDINTLTGTMTARDRNIELLLSMSKGYRFKVVEALKSLQ